MDVFVLLRRHFGALLTRSYQYCHSRFRWQEEKEGRKEGKNWRFVFGLLYSDFQEFLS